MDFETLRMQMKNYLLLLSFLLMGLSANAQGLVFFEGNFDEAVILAEKENKVQGKKEGLAKADEKAKADALAAEKAVNEARIAAATPAQEEE